MIDEKEKLLKEIEGLIEAKVREWLEKGVDVWQVWDVIDEVFEELEIIVQYRIEDILIQEALRRMKRNA